MILLRINSSSFSPSSLYFLIESCTRVFPDILVFPFFWSVPIM
jgi:hypothetical protein